MQTRLLYMPNEVVEGDETGTRAAFSEMLASGRLGAYEAFSFLAEERHAGWEGMLDKLLSTAIRFRPTAILWDLQTKNIVPAKFVRLLKALPSRPIIAQRTGDTRHSPPKPMVVFGREADLTILTSTSLIPAFNRRGCRDVRYLPERLCHVRFLTPWQRSEPARFDVVMTMNRIRHIRTRPYPLQRLRRRLVKALAKRFGDRFGLYGTGWEGWPCAQGYIPYSDQHSVLRQSRLIIGLNNFDHAYYFSNRLPVALTSRVPVLYKYFPGGEEMFREGEHLWFFHDVDDAMKKTDQLLALPQDQIDRVGRQGADWAAANFACPVWADKFLTMIEEKRAQQQPAALAGAAAT